MRGSHVVVSSPVGSTDTSRLLSITYRQRINHREQLGNRCIRGTDANGSVNAHQRSLDQDSRFQKRPSIVNPYSAGVAQLRSSCFGFDEVAKSTIPVVANPTAPA